MIVKDHYLFIKPHGDLKQTGLWLIRAAEQTGLVAQPRPVAVCSPEAVSDPRHMLAEMMNSMTHVGMTYPRWTLW